jgi:hypothetical protein
MCFGEGFLKIIALRGVRKSPVGDVQAETQISKIIFFGEFRSLIQTITG